MSKLIDSDFLTKQEKRVYEFIQQFLKEHEQAPTSEEIASAIGIQSRGVAHRYLKALQNKGCIYLHPKRHRNIELVQIPEFNPSMDYNIPILGAIAAGQPIEAVTDNESLDVLNIFAGPHRYALRVKGDSMIEEGIYDNDLVICEHCSTAQNGDIVVALIDQSEATLKRIMYAENGKVITLIPANSKYRAMHYPADRVTIQGIYIGLLRLT